MRNGSSQSSRSASKAWSEKSGQCSLFSRCRKFTRACSYDRAGILWSEPGPRPRDGETIAAGGSPSDLRTENDGADIAFASGLDDRIAMGETPAEVRALLARSAGIDDATPDDTAADLAARFDPPSLSTDPWVIDPAAISARRGGAAPS